jgi:hypothetical protein
VQRVIVRYRVKPDHAERNVELVCVLDAELGRTAPGGFHYGTFRLDDGLTVLHIVAQGDDRNDPPFR